MARYSPSNPLSDLVVGDWRSESKCEKIWAHKLHVHNRFGGRSVSPARGRDDRDKKYNKFSSISHCVCLSLIKSGYYNVHNYACLSRSCLFIHGNGAPETRANIMHVFFERTCTTKGRIHLERLASKVTDGTDSGNDQNVKWQTRSAMLFVRLFLRRTLVSQREWIRNDIFKIGIWLTVRELVERCRSRIIYYNAEERACLIQVNYTRPSGIFSLRCSYFFC